ncbi:hypothetical protein [Streptomyces sp. NPDC001070]
MVDSQGKSDLPGRAIRRRPGRGLLIAGVLSLLLCGGPLAAVGYFFSSPSLNFDTRPLAVILKEFQIALPPGVKDVSYRDFGKYQGDAMALKFSTDESGAESFVEGIEPGQHLEVGMNLISSVEEDEAGWSISESADHRGALLHGRPECGCEFEILAVGEGEKVTVYVYALKA